MARFHVAILFLVAVVGSIQCCDHEAQDVNEHEVNQEVPVTAENDEKAASDLECGFSCCGKPNGNYAIYGDCHHYWQCSCGHAYYRACPCGQHFSPCLRICVCADEKDDCEEKQKSSLKLKDILKV